MGLTKILWTEEQMNELDDKIHEQIEGIYDLPLAQQVPRFYELLRLSEEAFVLVNDLYRDNDVQES